MAKFLPLESVPGLSHFDLNDPLFRGWLEKIARNTELQSQLLRRVPTGTASPQAASSNLVVNVTSVTSITVTADEVWVKDIENNPELVLSVNSGAVSLASILDTGSVAINTWYYLFMVYINNTFGIGARLLASTSPTDPVLPAGYTHKGLLTAFRTNGAGALPTTFTQGKVTWITDTQVLTNGAAIVATAVSVATAVPPIGRIVSGWAQINDSGAGGSFLFISLDGTRGKQLIQPNAGATADEGGVFRVGYTASQIAYVTGAATNRANIFITGWEF